MTARIRRFNRRTMPRAEHMLELDDHEQRLRALEFATIPAGGIPFVTIRRDTNFTMVSGTSYSCFQNYDSGETNDTDLFSYDTAAGMIFINDPGIYHVYAHCEWTTPASNRFLSIDYNVPFPVLLQQVASTTWGPIFSNASASLVAHTAFTAVALVGGDYSFPSVCLTLVQTSGGDRILDWVRLTAVQLAPLTA